MVENTHPHVMSISGSDSGGGSGIQADLKTFGALRTFGTTVVTAVTAQNSREVTAIAEVPEEVVIAQIDSVIEDIGAAAIKTGMLSSRKILVNVADRLEAWGVAHLVVDPMIASKFGVPLLSQDAIASLRDELLPLASIVTVTMHEAEVLAEQKIDSDGDVEKIARLIQELGPDIVVITSDQPDSAQTDLVFDGHAMHRFETQSADTAIPSGTGCTFSAAITAFLAHGIKPLESIHLARLYVTNALEHAFPVGAGYAPLHHFAPLPETIAQRLGA